MRHLERARQCSSLKPREASILQVAQAPQELGGLSKRIVPPPDSKTKLGYKNLAGELKSLKKLTKA